MGCAKKSTQALDGTQGLPYAWDSSQTQGAFQGSRVNPAPNTGESR